MYPNPSHGIDHPSGWPVPGTQLAPAARGPAAEPGLSLLALLQAFRLRWPQATLLGLALAVPAAVAVWLLLPPQYQAVALVKVLSVEPKILGGDERTTSLEKNAYQKTQQAMLTSHDVLKAATERDEARDVARARGLADPVTWLSKRLRVGYIDDSDLLRLAVSCDDPAAAEVFANAVLDAYMFEVVDKERAEQATAVKNMTRILSNLQEKLQTEREDLADLARQLQTGDPAALTVKQKNAVEDHAAFRREMALVQGQLRAAQFRQRLLAVQLEHEKLGTVSSTAVDEAIDADPLVHKQAEEVQKQAKVFADFKRLGYPDTPGFQRAKAKLDQAQAELTRLREERRKAVLGQAQKRTGDDTKAQALKAAAEVKLLHEQYAEMRRQEQALEKKAEQLGATTFGFEAKRGEVEQLEAMLKTVRAEKEKLVLEQQSGKRRISAWQRAAVPKSRSNTLQLQATALVGLLGFVCGAGGLAYWEFRGRKVRTSDELTTNLDVQVLGTLPVVSSTGLQASLNDSTTLLGNNMLIESVSYIRAMLLASVGSQDGAKVLMVASAATGEGKTVVASQLATSLAAGGYRTLLIDGDLRRPSLDRMFDIPATPGLCELLAGRAALSMTVRETGVPHLALLPAGQCTAALIQSLSPRVFKRVLDQLRHEFEFVIVDSSPLLAVADGLVMARHADSVVLCARPGVSRFPAVFAARETLRGLGVPVLGIVMNGVRQLFGSSNYPYLSELPGESAANETEQTS